MTHVGHTSQDRPDDIHGTDEQNPPSDGPRRWYQARPGSRGSVNILGKDYPWWVAALIVLFIIV
jgi:hypothetical protein